MNENLNLVEILKNVPIGTKLWSPVCGECTLQYIDNFSDFPITCLAVDKYGRKKQILFTKYGWFSDGFAYSECTLFPSKDNRDWSTFKITEKHKRFEPFEKALVKVIFRTFPQIIRKWVPDIYLFYDEENSCHRVAINNYLYNDGDIIPFSDNENKVGKIAE